MDHGHENEVQKLREAQIFCTERGSSVQENSMSVPKRTMSVPEMRRLLGVKKTESYWLVHRNFFKTELVGGRMRVDVESFEKWYANQVKHKKVNGEAPGKELVRSSYSFREAANLLGVNSSNLYEIWKKNGLKTILVDFVMRIPMEEFERLQKKGGTGEILSHVVDKDGKLVKDEFEEHLLSLDLEEFKKIPIRVGVAYGLDKKEAILGVLRGGYVNVLITDEKVANYLIEETK